MRPFHDGYGRSSPSPPPYRDFAPERPGLGPPPPAWAAHGGDALAIRRHLPEAEYQGRLAAGGGDIAPIVARSGGSCANRSGAGGSSGACYLLALHFLAVAGLPKSSWYERTPEYEFFLRAGSAAKRLRPRIPAPPSDLREARPEVNVQELLPPDQEAIRLDERISLRLTEPAGYLQVDVWEERPGLLDIGASKAPSKRLLGQCCVPLETRFNRRPCTWPIVAKENGGYAPSGGGAGEVGFIVCKFGMATVPSPVRSLHVVEASVTATEVTLAWEPPASDGGTTLRGYRVEAREHAAIGSSGGFAARDQGLGAFLGEAPRTASAPPTAKPSVTLRGLHGNTAYAFRVWAVSEAGPGPVAELLGSTGAVAPGVCGSAFAADDVAAAAAAADGAEPMPHVAWTPPVDSGGAPIVAYRVWLRPLFRDSFGDIFPADGWIDLGLFEHRYGPTEPQMAPLMLDALPRCAGCLCSVAALNAAGHTGPSSPPAPVLVRPASPKDRRIYELPQSGPNSRVVSPVGTSSDGAPVGVAVARDAGPVAANGDVRFPWDPNFTPAPAAALDLAPYQQQRQQQQPQRQWSSAQGTSAPSHQAFGSYARSAAVAAPLPQPDGLTHSQALGRELFEEARRATQWGRGLAPAVG